MTVPNLTIIVSIWVTVFGQYRCVPQKIAKDAIDAYIIIYWNILHEIMTTGITL